MLNSTMKWGRHVVIAFALILLAGILLLVARAAGLAPTKSPAGVTPKSAERNADGNSPRTTIAAQNEDGPLRILPLGDSITSSDEDHLSYRYNLWIKLTDSGIDFDFVGSLDSNVRGNPAWPDHDGRAFDRDHEGHWGWGVDQILGGVPHKPNDKLSEWLKGYTPDIVLLHMGTNDADRHQTTSSTVYELKQVIRLLQADNPNVTVLLAKLIPMSDVKVNARIDELNSRIDDIAAEMTTAASPVIVVDQNSGFDADADTYDGVHPNESGEEKMASRWFEALQGVMKQSSAAPGRR